MRYIKVDNYEITTDVKDILSRLQLSLTNGKLKDINYKKDDIIVTCPHHNNGLEEKPACNIYIGDDDKLPYGYFRCFVCNEKGDFVKFVAECFNSSLDYAKNWLLKNFEHTEAFQKLDLGNDIMLNKPKRPFLDKSLLKNPYFQSYCPYLAQRGIPRDICEMFQVKYDSQYKQIVFPCFDKKGNLLMMPTRAIDKKIFYIDKNTPKPVYGLDQIVKLGIRRFIICEGFFDCLKCWANGIPAVALLGQMSDRQTQEINKVSPTVVYLGFDNDAAGQTFNKEIKEKLSSKILTVDLDIPKNRKDLGECSAEDFKKIMQKAMN